jgi:hypothetical protein
MTTWGWWKSRHDGATSFWAYLLLVTVLLPPTSRWFAWATSSYQDKYSPASPCFPQLPAASAILLSLIYPPVFSSFPPISINFPPPPSAFFVHVPLLPNSSRFFFNYLRLSQFLLNILLLPNASRFLLNSLQLPNIPVCFLCCLSSYQLRLSIPVNLCESWLLYFVLHYPALLGSFLLLFF